MQTDIHFLPYLAQFFLEWEMFETNLMFIGPFIIVIVEE